MRFTSIHRLALLALVAGVAGAAELTMVAPATSYFSPVCIEGTMAGDRLPKVRRYGIGGAHVRRLGPEAWYSNVRLFPDIPAVVTAGVGADRVKHVITWTSIDVDGPAVALTARAGDAIAIRTAGRRIQAIAPTATRLLRTLPGLPIRYTLTKPGSYRFAPPGGDGGVTVRVLAMPLEPDSDQPVALLADNRARRFPLPEGSDGLDVSSADPDLSVARAGSGVDLRVRTPGTHLGAVRLGTRTGPILGLVPVIGFAIDTRDALQPLPVAADGTASEPGVLTVIGDAVSPQRFRARIVMKPWVPNVKLTFTKFAHRAYFLGGATTFEVRTDRTPSTLGEPGFVVTTDEDGVRIGTFDYSIFSPPGNRSHCVRIVYRTLFSGEPSGIAWLGNAAVTP